MASKVSISVLIVSWVLCVFMHSTNMFIIAAVSVAASESSPLQLEAKALRESGWWSHQPNGTSLNHCEWNGIICNDDGSVTEIRMVGIYLGDNILRKFNFSSFPNLDLLDLSNAGLRGSIPQQIGTLSKLTYLRLFSNNLTGHFPLFLTNLTQLEYLYIYQNLISGPIPEELGNLKNLQYLDLSYNKLTGSIPSALGLLTNLWGLGLSSNKITGSVPHKLGDLKNLQTLLLGSNKLNGSIPLEIGNMKSLIDLSLSNNNIVGKIPSTIRHLTNLSYLSLSWNHISGSIPIEITKCSWLSSLSISHNNLTGSVPSGIGDLSLLRYVDLSYNHLIGNIPNSLININNLNLSYNSLEGQIPDNFQNYGFDAFKGNNDLCGRIKGFAPCPPSSQTMRKVKILITVPVFFALLLLGYFFYSRPCVRKTQSESKGSKNGDIFSIWNYDGKIAYEDIIQVTEDFDIRYCIGTGGYGSVYKAHLPSGNIVALKKLHRFEAEDPTFDKSFKNEIKILTEIRHRNIVKLHGYCLHK